MESLKKKIQNLSLRKFFMMSVLMTFCMVTVLSGLTIAGCIAFRNYLVPDSNAVLLTVEQTFSDGSVHEIIMWMDYGEVLQDFTYSAEDDEITYSQIIEEKYSIEKIVNSSKALTPKRKLAYQVCGVAMVAVPVFLSITGILICGLYFYKRKLSEPLRILSNATEQIAKQDLDFSLEYGCQDEMGQLCASFEQMRQALEENHKAMWELLEQRKLMQASIAHDLRNPIAIIEGYTEYLQMNLSEGRLSPQRMGRIVNNLNMAAKRLEHYTESIRTLNQLEDMEIDQKSISSSVLVEDISEDLNMMASNSDISLNINNLLPDCQLKVDSTILYRILENVFGNALRFAEKTISISFEKKKSHLCITVEDDGEGFSDDVLSKNGKLFLPTQQEDGHLGMGISMSRVLCEKHGGNLKFHNNEDHHAVVKIMIAV